jgi:hypothetical protein
MSNYTKTTDFEAKDSLPTGDSGKIIRGAEFETEFDAISTAIATKADTAGPTFTGTLTFETISDGTIGVTAFVDEDDMSSDSATLVPTQQSVKAYVDSQVTAQDLDFQADSGGALSIDLDSETLTFTGGTGVDTSGSGNAVTFAIDSTVATLTGTQTLTNKTLTSPDVNTPDIDGGTIDGTVIGGTTPAAVSATTVSATGNITVGGTVDGRDVATDGTKLDGIESGATADQTAAEIRTLVESATDSNVFTDADHTKLDGIEAGATGDQTNAEIRAAVEAATDSNVFTDADHSKLDGIEALADVTDTTNVTAAGAVMDSELTNETAVKSLDQGVATTDTPTFAGLATSANVTFGDNDKAIFGAGSDLQIYHDGSNSYINDTGTGNLFVRASDNFYVQNSAGTETKAAFTTDGAVTLYYNGGTKFQTVAGGVDVTGTVTADGLTVDGTSNFNGTINAKNVVYLKEPTSGAANGALFIADTQEVGIQAFGTSGHITFDTGSGVTQRMQIGSNGDISFYEDTGTTAKLFWDASEELLEVSSTGNGYAFRPSATNSDYALMHVQAQDGTAMAAVRLDGSSGLRFHTGGTNNAAERMRIDSSGNVKIGDATTDVTSKLTVSGNASASVATFMYDGSAGTYFDIDCNGAGGSVNLQADARTGAYPPLLFTTGGSESMRIDSSGNVGIGTTSPRAVSGYNSLALDGSTSGLLDINTNGTRVLSVYGASNDINLVNPTSTGAMRLYTNDTERMRIDSSGNMIMTAGGTIRAGGVNDLILDAGESGTPDIYLQSGGSTKVKIEGSNGNVGIGTSSPTEQLDVQLNAIVNESGAGDKGLFVGPSGFAGSFVYKSSGDAEIAPRSGKNLLFAASTGGTERMRIDSSGTLNLGTTLNLFGGADRYGFNFFASGQFNQSIDGTSDAIGQFINRENEDGPYTTFYKDRVAVGSISSHTGGFLKIDTAGNSSGLLFGTSAIYPIKNDVIDDDAVDLGDSSNRFKDLYLSGGAYLGGTGSANLLDDYEEGTWTPTIVGSTSGSITGFSIAKAVYVKVGDLVHVGVYLSNINMTASTCSGTIQLSNLPFTANSFTGVPLVSFCNMFTFDEADVSISGYVSGNDILLHRGSSTTAISDSDEGTNTAAAIMFSLTYEV